ncbi:MAG TPA: CAP domain-containing protein [Planctomycetota bacterium]|nr:CAP domain-containing protein [Planctomycetota bacterium]
MSALLCLALLQTEVEARLRDVESRLAAAENFEPLRDLRRELQRRRDAAFKVIGDTAVYKPEDHPDFEKGYELNGQEAVDGLVKAVREIWEAPSPSVEVDPALRKEVDGLLGGKAPPAGFEVLVHHLAQERLDVRSFCLDAKEAEAWAWNRKVDRYNAAHPDADVDAAAKAHAEVMNGYREMMGRRRLWLDGRLCRATRKHSAACDKAQKIWHAGPDGDPQTRARLEQFPAAVAENVAIAYDHPSEVWWRGWFRASDHHRTAISDAWTCFGYGYVGNVGTQNFATLPPPRTLR